MTTGIVLGGGIQPDGKLTTLSKQRLDAACVLFNAQVINKIIVLGGLKSTYFSNAIEFEQTGASKRAAYLRHKSIPTDRIHEIHDGKDTIGEAIAFKTSPFLASDDSFIVITSDLHMPRALWVFQKIVGSQIKLTSHEVDCAGILDANEEAEYFVVTKNWLERKSDASPWVHHFFFSFQETPFL